MSAPSHEIVSTRLLAWPREAVFPAFADPARLARWWGPKGFTSEFQRFEFRPGGAWRFVMRGPDGTAFAMDKEFTDIVPPARIALRHFQEGHDFTLTMTLADRDGKTELAWRMNFADAAEAERLRPFLKRANEENFDRLEAHLKESVSGPPGLAR
ncbi:MAG TPA: SRPBCC family protein [Opitutaceae bacterium]|nr:SRPBCC family protein [Opitutaceae bacterium]